MSLIGMMPTITATRTLTANLEVAAATNVTNATTGSARVPTATKPSTTGASIVFGAAFNYLVLQVLTSSTANVNCYVIGWNYSAIEAKWIPKSIVQLTVTPSTVSGAEIKSLRPGQSYTKLLGDARISNGDNNAVPAGHVVVDHAGSDLIELYFVGAAATSSNAMISFI